MQNTTWYYLENGAKKGPYTIAEMANKLITEETLVWTQNMANWEKAKHVKPLQHIVVPEPPSAPENNTNSSNSGSGNDTDPEAPEGPLFGHELASRKLRFFATLTETLLIGSAAVLIVYSFGVDIDFTETDNRPLFSFTVQDFLFPIGYALLSGLLFYPAYSGNLGHRIFKLKVISQDNGADFKAATQGVSRELVKNVFGLLLFPLFWILFDPNKQNFYDRIFKTIVVKRKG